MTDDTQILKNLVARLERLEKLLLPANQLTVSRGANKEKDYGGATGGIRFLADSGYFDKKRTFGEICWALEEKGYNYSRQAVQTPLNKLSSVKAGLLVALKEQGKKVYAKRK